MKGTNQFGGGSSIIQCSMRIFGKGDAKIGTGLCEVGLLESAIFVAGGGIVSFHDLIAALFGTLTPAKVNPVIFKHSFIKGGVVGDIDGGALLAGNAVDPLYEMGADHRPRLGFEKGFSRNFVDAECLGDMGAHILGLDEAGKGADFLAMLVEANSTELNDFGIVGGAGGFGIKNNDRIRK